MIGVPSRVVPLSAANAASTLLQFAVGCGWSGRPPTANLVYQKYVTIHMPSVSSQKYPNGVAGPLELPSIALRLLLTLQSCLRLGVATLVTGKHGLAARFLSCMVPQ